MNYPTAVDACAAYGEGASTIFLPDICKLSALWLHMSNRSLLPTPSPPPAGGLLAAPNTAEVLELLHSTLNSEQVDDFWVGIDDM